MSPFVRGLKESGLSRLAKAQASAALAGSGLAPHGANHSEDAEPSRPGLRRSLPARAARSAAPL